MRRDDNKIRIQLDSTVGEFKEVAFALDRFLTHIPISDATRNRVEKFRDMLNRQIMA